MPVRLCVGDPILVYLNKDDETQGIGLIKYIGFISGHDMTEYVGIELLEQCQNGHSGIINGFQYFTAKAKHGIHVRISNIIRKLNATEIVIKMQEVIEMFKRKLDQYINALTQRDGYIENLKQTHRDAKSLLKQAYDKIQSLKHEIHTLKMSQTCNIPPLDEINLTTETPPCPPPSNAPKRGKHGRNLSAQLKLDTIDDAFALSTPVADVPTLIDQLVQNMDNRRQSFNTVRTTSPITPMTPVTPSIDDEVRDTPASVRIHSVDDVVENKGKIYGKSFPDTEIISPKSPTESVHTSPSPSPNVHVYHNKQLRVGRHLQHISVGTELTEISAGVSEETPGSVYDETPDTRYDETCTPDTRYEETPEVRSPETEFDDETVRSSVTYDESEGGDGTESEAQLDDEEGNTTPCWSSSEGSEYSQQTRESYTFDSESESDTHISTPKPETPVPEKRKKKKRKRKKIKNTHHNQPKKNKNKNKPPPTNHKKLSTRTHRDRRKSNKKNKNPNQNVQGPPTGGYYSSGPSNNAHAHTQHVFPIKPRSQPSQPHHQHNTSMPNMHLQRNTHNVKAPLQNISAVAPPPHGNMRYNEYMVPQLDNWDVLQQQQRQKQQLRHKKQQITTVEPINIQNNPYLDQQYLIQQQQQQRSQHQQFQDYNNAHVYNNNQIKYQHAQQHGRGRGAPRGPPAQIKYHHKQYFSDNSNVNYQPQVQRPQVQRPQQQQQQRQIQLQHQQHQRHKARKPGTVKSQKVYVAPKGGRRSYNKVYKSAKNIQMFNVPVKQNNMTYIANYRRDEM